MIVFSAFDGMSNGQIALKELGFNVDKYYSSEIDKFAIKQTQYNFPNTIQLGNISKIKAKDLDKIDLFIGGSPCQGFSFAGKQLNFKDPRSALFFEYVRLWNEIKAINPNALFLLENVNMKKKYLRVMIEYMGVFPVRINSNLVSAQNRDRWYWSNIRTKEVGLFSELHTDIPQPKDRKILLKNILETDVEEKYFLSEKTTDWLIRHAKKRETRLTLNALNGKSKTLTVSSIKQNLSSNYVCVAMRKRDRHDTKNKSEEMSSTEKDYSILVNKKSDYGKQIRKDYENGKIKEKRKNMQQLEPRIDNKTNCLTCVTKDNLLLVREATSKGFTEIKPGQCVDLENINSKTRRGRKMENKSNCSMAGKTQFYRYTDNYRLRRLTPLECARLQTIPDWYKWIVSDTQIYKMLGNGWTVEVIKHIFSFITGFEKTK